MSKSRLNRGTIVVLVAILVVAFAFIIVLATSDTKSSTTSTPSAVRTLTNDSAPNAQSQTVTLSYLIEEEKLAHDVYVTLGDKWGSRVFGNILQSESTHQGLVAPLLATRNINDPRQASVGAFTDPTLQKLYNQLIVQGMQSETEAYNVGVIIEKTDIADLDKMLAVETDPQVMGVLNKLKQGSENHLRAFERQLNR